MVEFGIRLKILKASTQRKGGMYEVVGQIAERMGGTVGSGVNEKVNAQPRPGQKLKHFNSLSDRSGGPSLCQTQKEC